MRPKLKAEEKATSGFTLIELMVVVGIVAVIAVIAVPAVVRMTAAFRLRGAAAGVESLIQETRMRSVRDDRVYSIAPVNVNGAPSYCVVDPNNLAAPGGPPVANDCLRASAANGPIWEQTFVVPNNVQFIDEASAPSALPVPVVNGNQAYTQNPAGANVWPSFNARGLPCLFNAGTCSTLPGGTQVGFVYYLSTQAIGGGVLYRAVSLTPAGRVKLWASSGGAWK